ncbi:MAG: GntR family transcriptional regulator [Rhizobiales bacterium]|nr:GntR family transcriptional regulator [Hyphomicrobiales bacterium]
MTKPTDMSSITRAAEKQGVSLYLQLSNIFRGRIESGEWAVGERIPTVEELYKAYGVAGMTIRQALGILEDEGLIERFRAKGTFVRARPRRDLWCDVKTDISGLLLARPGAKIEVLRDTMIDELPEAVAEHGEANAKYRYLRRLHTREDEQFLLADVYIAEDVARLIKSSDLTSKTAMRLVNDLKGVSIADAKQILTIERADISVSQALQISLDSPIVKVVRIAYDGDGRTLMIAVGNYRSDFVRIEMHLR